MSKKICIVTRALSHCKVTKLMAFKGRCEIVRGFKVDAREYKIYQITFTIKRILTARQRQRDRSALRQKHEKEKMIGPIDSPLLRYIIRGPKATADIEWTIYSNRWLRDSMNRYSNPRDAAPWEGGWPTGNGPRGPGVTPRAWEPMDANFPMISRAIYYFNAVEQSEI